MPYEFIQDTKPLFQERCTNAVSERDETPFPRVTPCLTLVGSESKLRSTHITLKQRNLLIKNL